VVGIVPITAWPLKAKRMRQLHTTLSLLTLCLPERIPTLPHSFPDCILRSVSSIQFTTKTQSTNHSLSARLTVNFDL
jgi:hypothetical protein